METAHELRIDVWSDIACPWCYVGKRRMEAALESFPGRDSVRLVWRAFELDPSAPPVRQPESHAARLARKYGASVSQAEQMIRRMTETAALDGLDLRFDIIRPGNTFDAHRLIHFALERGVQDAVKERFLRAYLCEGEAIGDRSTLVRLSGEAGLDAKEAERVLDSEAFAREVRADEAEARASEIHGVPFFVFAGRYGVSGAQIAETLHHVLERAWREEASSIADEAACGPDGCAVPGAS